MARAERSSARRNNRAVTISDNQESQGNSLVNTFFKRSPPNRTMSSPARGGTFALSVMYMAFTPPVRQPARVPRLGPQSNDATLCGQVCARLSVRVCRYRRASDATRPMMAVAGAGKLVERIFAAMLPKLPVAMRWPATVAWEITATGVAGGAPWASRRSHRWGRAARPM